MKVSLNIFYFTKRNDKHLPNIYSYNWITLFKERIRTKDQDLIGFFAFFFIKMKVAAVVLVSLVALTTGANWKGGYGGGGVMPIGK